MGWQDRDWAKRDEQELRRLYGGAPSGPATPFWQRRARPVHAILGVLLGAAAVLGAVGHLHLPASGASPAGISPGSGVDGVVASGGTIVPWPAGTIRLYNAAPDQEWALQQAAAAWNASGVAVHFGEVQTAGETDVVIEHAPAGSCGHADATLGDVPDAHVDVFALGTDPQCNQYWAAVALAHELGHVLGLAHTTDRCSAMNPRGNYRGPELCTPLDPGIWYCRLLEPVDVEHAAALYGGTPQLPAGRGCPLYTAIPPPPGLRLEPAAPGTLAASFERPPDPPLPSFLQPEAGTPTFSALATPNACEGSPGGQRYRWSGDTQTLSFREPPGRYCLEVWAYDALGRPSATSSVAFVDVTG